MCHVTASSAGSSRRLFFVRMFFNPSFTKPSHVASVLCECLEMASRRCLLAACAGRSSSSPFFRPPVPPLHHGLLGTSFSIRLALPFRIVPFALHSVTSMAVRLLLGGALDTVASTSTSLSPSPSPPSPVLRFASLVAFPLPPRAPPSPSLLGPFAILLLLRVAPPSSPLPSSSSSLSRKPSGPSIPSSIPSAASSQFISSSSVRVFVPSPSPSLSPPSTVALPLPSPPSSSSRLPSSRVSSSSPSSWPLSTCSSCPLLLVASPLASSLPLSSLPLSRRRRAG